MKTRTAEERIERAHLAIMRHPTFCAWSGLLFIGGWSVTNIPTACVYADGRTEYGRGLIDSFQQESGTDVYVNWVILHEKGHMALMHMTRNKDLWEKNPRLANIAADYVVNYILYESDPNEQFAKHPRNPDGTMRFAFDAKYKGWSMKEVYMDLLKNAQVIELSGGGFDEHKPGDSKGEEMSAGNVDQLHKEIDQALRTGSYLAGKMGGNTNRLFGDVLDAQIDWREELAEFIMDVCQGEDNATWRRPNMRFVGADMYLPSFIGEACGEIVCASDVSGSVSDAENTACISEVIELCRAVRPSKLRLIYWDDGIRREEIYTPEMYDDIVRLTRPVGGGGTVITEVAKYVNSLPDVQCAIVLTDGAIYGGFGEWNVPTLWALTRRHVQSPVGKSLHIDV